MPQMRLSTRCQGPSWQKVMRSACVGEVLTWPIQVWSSWMVSPPLPSVATRTMRLSGWASHVSGKPT